MVEQEPQVMYNCKSFKICGNLGEAGKLQVTEEFCFSTLSNIGTSV